MAGRGKRFKDAGYEVPKPFIKVDGEPMFSRRIDNIINNMVFEDVHIVIIILKEHQCYLDDIRNCLESFRRSDIVKRTIKYDIKTIPEITEGMASTALLVKDLIDLNRQTWITDCDHLIDDTFYFQESTRYFESRGSDAGLICHLSDNPKWSYCKISDKRACYVAEKEVISNVANCGDYYYSTGKLFVENAEEMIYKNDRSKTEFYLAPTMNYIIRNGGLVMPYMINNMKPLGIPEDLQKYENVQQK